MYYGNGGFNYDTVYYKMPSSFRFYFHSKLVEVKENEKKQMDKMNEDIKRKSRTK